MVRMLSLLSICFLLGILPAIGQNTGSVKTFTLNAEALKREVKYNAYLPPSYNTSDRAYPVIYLLHGMWGDYSNWATKGDVQQIAAKTMNAGKAPEMIIIMPEGLIDAFYINNYDKSVNWEDFFYNELIPAAESELRVMKSRNTRAIAGLSMGGYGSLYHALRHKDMFSAVYAMSAAVLEVEPAKPGQTAEQWNRALGEKLWGPLNKEGLPTNYAAHSVQEMVKAMPQYKPAPMGSQEVPLPFIFLDCGDDDFLLQQNMNLARLLKEKQIPFEFRVRDGGHTWQYWREALEMALVEIGNKFMN